MTMESDDVRKYMRFMRTVVPLFIAGVLSLPWLTSAAGSRDWLQLAIAGWMMAIGYVYWYPWNYRRDVTNKFIAAYTTMPFRGLAGRWHVSIARHGLQLKTPLMESCTYWRAVGQTKITAEFVFIDMLGKQSPLDIPRRAFTSQQQLDEWVRLVRARTAT